VLIQKPRERIWTTIANTDTHQADPVELASHISVKLGVCPIPKAGVLIEACMLRVLTPELEEARAIGWSIDDDRHHSG
jgi:hypothetical protein